MRDDGERLKSSDSAYTVDLGNSALPVTDLNPFREKRGWLKGLTQQD